ncbi:MAG: ABC transporter permease subunit [SAR202 cluster bacterium]|nr:ABC transporter permease subunit [SAR202 cluster bacterium]
MKEQLHKYITGTIFVIFSLLALVGVPDSFPFYAPGQEQHEIEGQRIQKVDKIKVSIGDTDVKPTAVYGWIDSTVLSLKVKFKTHFRSLVNNLLKAMVPLQKELQDMPWYLFAGLLYLIAWKVNGHKIAVLSVTGLFILNIFNLWDGAMVTMAVVGTATFLSIVIAVPVGILAAKSDRVEKMVKPMLDMAQTMPSFVYLIPAIFFLGIGMVPAVFATIVYAVPPGIRLTNLGIRLVSPELKETARAFGTTPWQLLVKVELPLARPTIMAGINQTVMMALAMVVIAALVGAGGLGADVYAGVQQLEFGRGLMGGLGIVILAVIIDRISQGFVKDPSSA